MNGCVVDLHTLCGSHEILFSFSFSFLPLSLLFLFLTPFSFCYISSLSTEYLCHLSCNIYPHFLAHVTFSFICGLSHLIHSLLYFFSFFFFSYFPSYFIYFIWDGAWIHFFPFFFSIFFPWFCTKWVLEYLRQEGKRLL